MAYVRKTTDEWEVQVLYGNVYGWECVFSATSWRDAKARAKEYRDNQPYQARIIKRRVPITPPPDNR